MTRSITFRVPEELYAMLQADSAQRHRTVSQQLRLILEQHYRTDLKGWTDTRDHFLNKLLRDTDEEVQP